MRRGSGQKARVNNSEHVTTCQPRAPVLTFLSAVSFFSFYGARTAPARRIRCFAIMAGFLRRLSVRHAVAGGVLGVSGLSFRAHALRIEEDTKLDFKDVLLRPKRSELASRAQVCAHLLRTCAREPAPCARMRCGTHALIAVCARRLFFMDACSD